ncbi:transglycosylase SLT domain-containing protein [Fretibacter rubidus]|uniref:lytic transglycosylase domain-containing protein n=1 Tax=Fretibacter rubidus TaxID=570162 RepID=UPI00352AD943
MIPTPRVKPPAPNLSKILSDADAKLFRKATSDARRGQWSSVMAARRSLSNSAAKDALLWLRAARDPNAPLSDLTYAVHNLTDWPRMTTIRSKAEKKLLSNPVGITSIAEWFRGYDPVSGEGRIALAQDYFRQGNDDLAKKWLKLGWREARLTRDLQRSVFKTYGKHLTPQDHAARADYLVWQGRRYFDSAQGLLSLMPRNDAKLIAARMALRQNSRAMNAAVDAVPSALQGDPGFSYERAYWRRKRKSKDYALPVLLNINAAPKTERGQERLWNERRLMAYWAISERNFETAYQLTRNHGMTRGGGFAGVEFLAGWLSLTKLNNPRRAMEHFTTLRNNVGLPVSLSRAAYWQGRASEALRDGQEQLYYADAAQHVNTFYGLLAADKLSSGGAQIVLPPEPNVNFERASFNADPRVQAARLFAEANQELFYTQMSFHLDDEFERPEQLSLLAEMGRDFGYMKPSVRAAKQAGRLQTMLTESGYPIVPAIEGLDDRFEKAFVYGIARQESEFNYSAVSHANAYGLMQMINATARSTARRHRIPYSRTTMTTDINYSANLGAHHLHDLLKDYDGSYIMACIAYNAGPRRVTRWTKDYGDPRKGEIDPIDFLESIPFSETRNYVQRVIENMQIYRARRSGGTAPNRIDRDLRVGSRYG